MKLALIGVGLIGGSLALAARAASRVTHVIGADRDRAALAQALALGVIDSAADSAAKAVAGADLVVIAVPVGAIDEVLREIASALLSESVITDVGSTKASVIAAARERLGGAFSRFVPAHPIAGGERPGVDHARAALFRGKRCIMTPVAETDAAALATVESLWQAVGCRVERMNADEHDRIFAAVSHLPHVLAYALVAQLAERDDAARLFGLAGAGFRDFTRIAASSPEMWRDICLANRLQIGPELQRYRVALERLQCALDDGDAVALERTMAAAATARRQLSPASDAE